MKKTMSLFLVVTLLLVLSQSAFATNIDSGDSENELTQEERSIILNEIGIKEEELKYYTTKALRYLIENDAVKLSASEPQDYSLQSQKPDDNSVGTMDLTKSDITLYANAYEVNSDVPGSKKIYIYGSYTWKVEPIFALTDKMSIGYPVTNEWYLRTSAGTILGHESNNCNYKGQWKCTSSNVPSDHDIGQGVAAKYDIWADANFRQGDITQYVYTTKKSGKSNINLRYGHRYLTGAVGVSVYPSGLAVTPAIGTETLDYPITISW
ncbi:hypothetical protein HF638_09875 [Paenibacillus sp. SZ31]|uniref:hypothetical protein n=1 Tax=Paenibacillus sp. SZ31 TaxID=2725555 RepID=UPI00146AB906|nr:hypothetical protein [Paenibacillus sp. SZ31]NMI04290.1 hypothetical protein [Paenibacillus sp. SZ31]